MRDADPQTVDKERDAMHPIGKNIKILRQMQGVTQTRLAEAVGVAPAYISQIESMIRVPSVKVTHRIADALGTTVGTLLGENPEATTDGRLSRLEQIHLLKRLVLELETELQEEDERVEQRETPVEKGIA